MDGMGRPGGTKKNVYREMAWTFRRRLCAVFGVLLPVSMMLIACEESPLEVSSRAANVSRSNSVTPTTTAVDSSLNLAVEFAVQQMSRSITELSTSQHARSTRASDGSWTSTAASVWTSGFFAGTQWLLYELTGDASWRTRAEAQTAALAGQELNGTDHDIGFRIMSSFGQGYRLTGSSSYRERILTAARTFAGLYHPRIGMTRSQPPRTIGTNLACRGPVSVSFPVIVDNMMNLELFFRAAAEGGDPQFHQIAVSHALRTIEHHMRPDGSHWQYVDFDTAAAAVRFKGTHQGYCDDTTWARGQSWAVYGFTMAYRYTQDTRFLAAATLAADYFLDHLPADRVPYWDFGVPNPGAGTPKEASAAAVAAAGLLELAGYAADSDRYRNAALAILHALASSPYLAKGTPHRSILLHSNGNVNSGSEVDVGHIYADYYFLQAVLRYRELPVVVPPGNQPPTAALTSSCSALTCSFTDQSTDADGSVVAWSWNFGDGTSSTTRHPSHSYAAGGTYAVTLSVTDDDGAVASTNASVSVTSPAAVVAACTPKSAARNAQLLVQVTGGGFQPGAMVSFGESVAVQRVQFVSASRLDVRIRVHAKAVSGGRTVTVSNPDGRAGSLAGCFTVS
jgi:unsaturated chondroitin disaccharide hydrolase